MYYVVVALLSNYRVYPLYDLLYGRVPFLYVHDALVERGRLPPAVVCHVTVVERALDEQLVEETFGYLVEGALVAEQAPEFLLAHFGAFHERYLAYRGKGGVEPVEVGDYIAEAFEQAQVV